MSVMSAIKFTVPMEPRPAPRVASNGKQRYELAWYREYKDRLATFAKLAMHGRAPLTGNVKFYAECYRNRNPASRNFGDWDNHGKAICDALNGICFTDDAAIVNGQVWLFKGKPHIYIELQEVITNGKNSASA